MRVPGCARTAAGEPLPGSTAGLARPPPLPAASPGPPPSPPPPPPPATLQGSSLFPPSPRIAPPPSILHASRPPRPPPDPRGPSPGLHPACPTRFPRGKSSPSASRQPPAPSRLRPTLLQAPQQAASGAPRPRDGARRPHRLGPDRGCRATLSPPPFACPAPEQRSRLTLSAQRAQPEGAARAAIGVSWPIARLPVPPGPPLRNLRNASPYLSPGSASFWGAAQMAFLCPPPHLQCKGRVGERSGVRAEGCPPPPPPSQKTQTWLQNREAAEAARPHLRGASPYAAGVAGAPCFPYAKCVKGGSGCLSGRCNGKGGDGSGEKGRKRGGCC